MDVPEEKAIILPSSHVALAERKKCNAGGKDCGYRNVSYFAGLDWPRKLMAQVADQALSSPAFVERWTACGLYTGRHRTRKSVPSSFHVAEYHRRGNQATNLTVALMAKATRTTIYVVTKCPTGFYVTEYSGQAMLDAQSSVGCAVCDDAAIDAFRAYSGPVLLYLGHGHWNAFPRSDSPRENKRQRRL